MQLENLRMFQYLQRENNDLASQVKQTYKLVYEPINNISSSYGNFTMHDMNHGLRVANYMEMLAFGIDESFDENITKFSHLEIALMILSAILHDIGMIIREEDRQNIKNNIISYTKELTYSGVLSMSESEEEAIKEIVRRTHADRIRDFIEFEFNDNKISNILVIDNNYPYAEDVVEICSAHGHEHIELKNIRDDRTKGNYVYNSRYIAALLRIADLLDIDKQRTPILWYKFMNLKGISKDEWETHFIIENNIKIKPYMDGKNQIYFDGLSRDAKIHRKYLAYIDYLKMELESTIDLLNTENAEQKYRFNVVSKIDDRVRTEGFTYSDLRLNLDYSSITDLLMGENIYGDKKLGLREIVQNSIDACEIMNEIKDETNSIFTPVAEIYLIISEKNRYVKIKDTGVGMTLDIIKKHFLNVGKSYYKSREYLFKDYEYKPIGQYGIGFLSCFLLSDTVIVKTKHYKNHEINQIELEKRSEYVVTTLEETSNFLGTEITLDYESFMRIFENKENVCSFLQEYFFTKVKITVLDEDTGEQIHIKNKYINSFDTSNNKYKYDVIECSELSDKIEGSLVLRMPKRNFKNKISKICKGNSYLYDASANKFVLFEDIDTPRKCICITYVDIEESRYKEIKDREKKKDRLCTSLIALAKKENKLVELFIDNKDMDKFPYYMENRNKERESLKEIISNSGFVYFDELLCEHRITKRVFVYDSSFIDIDFALFHNRGRYGYYYEDEDEESGNNAYVYNKGILISDSAPLACYLPYKLTGFYGCINIKNIPIKLDVSRNRISDGRREVADEINKIILRYKINTEKEEIKCFMEQMLYLYDE